LKHLSTVWIILMAYIVMPGNAQTATVTGVIFDSHNQPVSNATITIADNGTISDESGFYSIQVPSETPVDITVSFLGFKDVQLKNLILTTNETYFFNPILEEEITQIAEVTVSPSGERETKGIKTISNEIIRNIPGANAGVENIIKLLPGVTSNNELSTQYNVRGGNFDENLVYINGIEVYRPFLIRSAQQEGLSFVNSDMVQSVEFSSGGFQAKYGDKLSSALDIRYKTPSSFATTLDLSFLGAAATLETISKDKNFGSVSGIRYRNNSLLVNSTNTTANFRPRFIDFQTFDTYRFSEKFHLNFLGNLSINDYRNEPLSRQTNFGTLSEPRTLIVFYEGNENNRYQTVLGALKANYFPDEKTTLNLISSIYHTTEKEYSDVIATYRLSPLESEMNSGASAQQGLGSQFRRARNDLDALIVNLEHQGSRSVDHKKWEWGVKYTHEDIRDQIRESEFLDSLGYSVRPPLPEFQNNEPNVPFEAPLVAYSYINARNYTYTNRISGFLQFSNRITKNVGHIYYNLGVRSHYWNISSQELSSQSHVVISPRGQLAFKPEWNIDMLFRLSGGLYHQPPFYRELRDASGNLQPQIDAQRSEQIVLANEYSFNLWSRPFNLTSEVYYKNLENVNPYTLNDVRIRYVAANIASAYAYGFDLRLNGAFVPGTESWVSLGLLKTEENWNNRGYIARPTDQRIKLGVLFQDYVPQFPDFRMYLNLVYNTGLPGGSPNYVDPYEYQNRLRTYKRADLGISYIFASGKKMHPKNNWRGHFKELSAGLELYNMFNNQNSITNTWVRDVESKNQYAIPNFMTSRILNLRIRMRF